MHTCGIPWELKRVKEKEMPFWQAMVKIYECELDTQDVCCQDKKLSPP
jgi:hypothetical protein